MHPRISLNSFTTFTEPLGDDLALCRELGIQNLGLVTTKYEPDPGAAAEQCRAAGVNVSFVATHMGNVSPLELGARAGAAVLEQLRLAIDAAQTLGAHLVYFPSGAAPRRTPSDPAFDALARALEPAVAYGAARGVRLGVENNSVSTRHHGFVHTMADAVRLAEMSDIDICMEIQNAWVESGLEPLFKAHASRIAVVQVSDFVVGEELRMNRCVPGDGDIPLEWMIGTLLDAGYTGLFDIELVGPHIDKEGVVPAIRRSEEWLAELLTRLGA